MLTLSLFSQLKFEQKSIIDVVTGADGLMLNHSPDNHQLLLDYCIAAL